MVSSKRAGNILGNTAQMRLRALTAFIRHKFSAKNLKYTRFSAFFQQIRDKKFFVKSSCQIVQCCPNYCTGELSGAVFINFTQLPKQKYREISFSEILPVPAVNKAQMLRQVLMTDQIRQHVQARAQHRFLR